jgi:hypothetical protein
LLRGRHETAEWIEAENVSKEISGWAPLRYLRLASTNAGLTNSDIICHELLHRLGNSEMLNLCALYAHVNPQSDVKTSLRASG